MCNHCARDSSGSFLTFISLSLIILVFIMQHFKQFPYVTVREHHQTLLQMRLLAAPKMSTEGLTSMSLCPQNWFPNTLKPPPRTNFPICCTRKGRSKETHLFGFTYSFHMSHANVTSIMPISLPQQLIDILFIQVRCKPSM